MMNLLLSLTTVVALVESVDCYAGRDQSEYDYSWAVEAVNRTQIREYLMELARQPHLAGLERDEELAAWIADTWRDIGNDLTIG